MKRVSFLAIVMVVAIATLGAAYTLWYEDLSLHADVSTGTLDASITCRGLGDNDSGNTNHPLYPDPGKDIGVVGGIGTAPKDLDLVPPSTDDDTNHGFLITVTNAYPGYFFDCEFDLENTGNVAWHIESFTVEVHKNGVALTPPLPLDCGNALPGTRPFCELGELKLTGPNGDPNPFDPNSTPLFITYHDMSGCQVHGGDKETASLEIGVNQAAMENSTYEIWLFFTVNQWNESDWQTCNTVRNN